MTEPVVLRGRRIDRPGTLVMGVLNVTPDSFSDGGSFLDAEAAVAHAERLVAQGADLLDIGGESTRPGAALVREDEELRRVLPVIEGLRKRVDVPLSIDTRKPGVARAALEAGADCVNDVTGFTDPAMVDAVARARAGAVVMHMRGTPETMQEETRYGDVVTEVRSFLLDRARALEAAGIAKASILIDPGIGFAKDLEHNLAILARLDPFVDSPYNVLVGVSRKRFLATLTTPPGGAAPEPRDRVDASVAAHVACALAGVRMVRVHDVAPHRRALAVADAIRDAGRRGHGSHGDGRAPDRGWA